MLKLHAIDGFDWDEHNGPKISAKHAVEPSEVEQIFFNEPLLLSDDVRHSQAEPRFHALGRTMQGRVLHVTFTLRASGALIRVISARDANHKERKRYGEA